MERGSTTAPETTTPTLAGVLSELLTLASSPRLAPLTVLVTAFPAASYVSLLMTLAGGVSPKAWADRAKAKSTEAGSLARVIAPSPQLAR
jgi:hypothetical protein